MMMLSSTEAVSSAKASNIISDLRNLKTATAAWYTDHLDIIQANGQITWNGAKDKNIQGLKDSETGISKYLNNNIAVNTKGDGNQIPKGEFGVYNADSGNNNRTTWFVGYRFKDGEDEVREKVKAKATSLGLHFSEKWPETNVNGNYSCVWMKVSFRRLDSLNDFNKLKNAFEECF